LEGEGNGMGVMASIGGEKLTKDLIRKNGIFSANLVTEELLPLADYYGCVGGREHPDKMRFSPTIEKGVVLNVPTIAESPVSMELKVFKEISLGNSCDIYLCKIMGETMREDLANREVPFIDRFNSVKQVLAGGEQHYVSTDGRDLGSWGEPMRSLKDQ
ncbi:MAG: flavin reductase family protein, partial [Clostridiales bacterium]|nr:flavin reductase family protein [Clostridiales bacterium]